MRHPKNPLQIITFLGLIAFFTVVYFNSSILGGDINQPPKTSSGENQIPKIKLYSASATGTYELAFEVKGMSMEPLLKNGSIVKVSMNYYNQHPIQNGDVVIFENPFSLERIIKRVLLSPGTIVKKNTENSTLFVNGEILKNSTGTPYIFDEYALKLLDIYTKSGAITENNYFLFGDNVRGSIDSRNNGPVSREGILGKVEMYR